MSWEIDMTATHVTIGANVDFSEYLERAKTTGSVGEWPVKKSAKVGDRVVFLIPSMHGDLRAYGSIAGEPKLGSWGDSPRYFAEVKDVHAIVPSVPIALIRQAFPDWAWAGYARIYTTVPHDLSEEFWQLIKNPPLAYDTQDPPERIESVVSRFIRDTAAARALKAKYRFKCQVCGLTLPHGDGQHYVEAHHLRPLGRPHDGPDAESNMLVLCPNHHALFDLAVPRFVNERTLKINGKKHSLTLKHAIARSNIRYYTKHVIR